jgi:hypothetical protein
MLHLRWARRRAVFQQPPMSLSADIANLIFNLAERRAPGSIEAHGSADQMKRSATGVPRATPDVVVVGAEERASADQFRNQ